MSDYRRFITYINLYENDQKLRNVGFAKIDKRKEQCRFEIHMKNIGYTGQNSQIYFYVQQEQALECISIGALQIINGTADRRLLLNGENLAGSGYRLEEISGLVIFINEEIMLASQWQEGEMRRGLFRLPGQERPQDLAGERRPQTAPAPAEPAVQSPKQSRNTATQSATARNAADPQSAAAPAAATPPPAAAPPATAPQPTSPQAESQGQPEPEPDTLHVAEAAVNPSARPWSVTWQMMLESYPVMTPFEGEEDINCIRIELKELRLLPKRYWYLGNNSFLLHGFFNYRYLILGQMQENGIKRWFLGVPGVFQNQEKVMAAIFGFPEFKAEKAARQKTNQFGYWYRFMDE